MANITAALVKELRERTGAGMMDCKKALVAADGDIEKAIDDMRKNGQAKAAKKAGRVTAEGVIVSASSANGVFIAEINCETDFVAKDASFNEFCNNVVALAAENNVTDVAALKDHRNEARAVHVDVGHAGGIYRSCKCERPVDHVAGVNVLELFVVNNLQVELVSVEG